MAFNVRLKFLRFTALNRGSPWATLRRIRGQRAWAGQTAASLAAASLQKQGRRMIQPDVRFLRHGNFAKRNGSPSAARTPIRACSG